MSKIAALAKREFIEHRNGIFTTPAIVMTLMLVLTIGSLLSIGWGDIAVPMHGRHAIYGTVGELLDGLTEAEPTVRAGIVVAVLSAMTLPALLVLPFVVFFILLGALYEERRDRSFLFWKSLPVSDTAEVLVRLGAGAVLAPLGFLVVGYAFQLIALLLISLIGGLQGGSVGVIWQVGAILANWIHSPFFLLMWMAWALPVFAWVLFCSAYAPRAPFMYAVVPPVALILVENVFLKTNTFGAWIGRHLSGAPMFEHFGRDAERVFQMSGADEFELAMAYLADPNFQAIFASLREPELWIGLLIAAVLTYGAVWLRRYNL